MYRKRQRDENRCAHSVVLSFASKNSYTRIDCIYECTQKQLSQSFTFKQHVDIRRKKKTFSEFRLFMASYLISYLTAQNVTSQRSVQCAPKRPIFDKYTVRSILCIWNWLKCDGIRQLMPHTSNVRMSCSFCYWNLQLILDHLLLVCLCINTSLYVQTDERREVISFWLLNGDYDEYRETASNFVELRISGVTYYSFQ